MNSEQDRWSGEYYKKYRPQDKDWILTPVEELNLRGDEVILDVGCGDGRITVRIAKMVSQGSVVGIDASPSMVESAKNSHDHANNFSFKVVDATNFSLEQKFDYAVSFFVLHWIKDQLSVFKNIKNVLKPKGTLIFVMNLTPKNVLNQVSLLLHS